MVDSVWTRRRRYPFSRTICSYTFQYIDSHSKSTHSKCKKTPLMWTIDVVLSKKEQTFSLAKSPFQRKEWKNIGTRKELKRKVVGEHMQYIHIWMLSRHCRTHEAYGIISNEEYTKKKDIYMQNIQCKVLCTMYRIHMLAPSSVCQFEGKKVARHRLMPYHHNIHIIHI